MFHVNNLRVSYLPVLLACLIIRGTHDYACAQGQPDKTSSTVTFHVESLPSTYPLKLLRVSVGGRDIPLDSPVPVEGNWLHGLSIEVQNTAPKTLVHAMVNLLYTGTVPVGPFIGTPIGLGVIPDTVYRKHDGTMRPRPANAPQVPEIAISPGSKFMFVIPGGTHLQADLYDRLGHDLTVIITFDQFNYSDGTEWLFHEYYAPVPPPELWKKIAPADFFGSDNPHGM